MSFYLNIIFVLQKKKYTTFFLNTQISLENYKELINAAITSGEVYFFDRYLHPNPEELKSLVNRRILFFKELKEIVKLISRDIKNILDKNYVLFVGISPGKTTKVYVFVKQGSKDLVSLRIKKFEKKWLKKRQGVEVLISDSSKEFFESRKSNIHKLSLELMNMNIVINRSGFYEKFLGHILFIHNPFPNYPLINFRGIKFEKNLPEQVEESPVTRYLNKVVKYFN